jgi:hypothetical protein
MVYHDRLFLAQPECLASVTTNWHYRVWMNCDLAQWLYCAVDISVVLAQLELISSLEHNQYLFDQFIWMEWYIMIYQIIPICWFQQHCLVCSIIFGTMSESIRARLNIRVTIVSYIDYSWESQIMSERTCLSKIYKIQYCQSNTCQSHTCQSHINQTMIVRDDI